MYTLTVTNTLESGEGSLRWAIEQANVYTGPEEIEILFDEALAGAVITTESRLILENTAVPCTITGPSGGVSLSETVLCLSQPATLSNLVVQRLEGNLLGSRCQNVICLDETGVVLWTDIDAITPDDLQNLGVIPASYPAYIGISGQAANSGQWDEFVLQYCPEPFQGYMVIGELFLDSETFSVNIASGVSLVVDQGATIQFLSQWGDLWVEGALELRPGSSVVKSGESAWIRISEGGVLRASDCTLDATLALDKGAQVEGSGITITAQQAFSYNLEEAGEVLGILSQVDYACAAEDAYALLSLPYMNDGEDASLSLNNEYLASLLPEGCQTVVLDGGYGLTEITLEAGTDLTVGSFGVVGTLRCGAGCTIRGVGAIDPVEGDYAELYLSGSLYAEDLTLDIPVYLSSSAILEGDHYHFGADVLCTVNGWDGTSPLTGLIRGVSYDVTNPDANMVLLVNAEEGMTLTKDSLDAVDAAGFNRVLLGGVSVMGGEVVMSGLGMQDVAVESSFTVNEGGSLVWEDGEWGEEVYVNNDAGKLTLRNTVFHHNSIYSAGEFEMQGCSGEGTLYLSGAATITDCDLSRMDIEIDPWNLENGGGMIEFNGNDWGENVSLVDVFARFGDAARYVLIDGMTYDGVPQEGYVYSAEASGAGSLAAVLAQANASTADEPFTITVAESLGGTALAWPKDLVLGHDVVISGKAGVILSGNPVVTEANIDFQTAATVEGIVLQGGGAVHAGQLCITGEECLRLPDFSGSLDERFVVEELTLTGSAPYVSLYGTLGSLTLSSNSFSEYKLIPPPDVPWHLISKLPTGACMQLGEGVHLDLQCGRLEVYGELVLEHAEIRSDQDGGSIMVAEGASLRMLDSTIVLGGEYHSGLDVVGEFIMRGGCLDVPGGGWAHGLFGAFGSVDIEDAVIHARIGLAGASSVRLANTSGIIALTLSLDSDIVLSGNDFSSTNFELYNASQRNMLYINNCEWGTENIVDIFSRFGDAAPYVVVDGIYGSALSENKLTVTNTEDSGLGSLRWAVAQAAQFPEDVLVEISFAPELAGQVITLESTLALTRKLSLVNLAENPVRVEGAALSVSADMNLENMVLSSMSISPHLELTGSGNVFTGEGAVILLTHANLNLAHFQASAEQEGAYIGITGGRVLDEIHYKALGRGLDTYRLNSMVKVEAGATLFLDEGVVLESLEYRNDLEVYGTLVAEKANFVLVGHSQGTGGELSSLIVRDGGAAKLSDATVSAYDSAISSYGDESKSSVYVCSGGTLEMEGCTLENVNYFVAEAGSAVSLVSTELQRLNTSGVLQMDHSTVKTQMMLNAGADVRGSENVFTGEGAVIWLSHANVDMSRFQATAEQEGAYIGISGGRVLTEIRYKALGAGLDTYVLNSMVRIEADATLYLDEGVHVRSENATSDIDVYGTLVSDSGYLDLLGAKAGDRVNVRVYSGASVVLNGTVVQGADSSLSVDSEGNFHVDDGGSLKMTDAVLVGVDGIHVESGGTFQAQGGTYDTWMRFEAGAAASIHQADLSGAHITVAGAPGQGQVIDLSGNYWGTTDRDAILAKIRGYNPEYVLLDNWLAYPPENALFVDGLAGSRVLSAQSREVTVRFSGEVSADSITDANLYLEDAAGNRIPVLEYTVQGAEVTLHFDPLPADGTYHLVVGQGIAGTDGRLLQEYISNLGAGGYRVALSADVTAEQLVAVQLQEGNQPTYVDLVFNGTIDPASVGSFLLVGGGGTFTITAQQVSSPSPGTLRLQLPALNAVGDYQLQVQGEITDYAGNPAQIPSSVLGFTVYSADLAVAADDSAYTGFTHGEVAISLTVSNHGNGAASQAKVEIWLTKDGQITEDAILLDIATLPDLEPGQQISVPRTLLLEQAWDLAEGEYQLVARATLDSELTALGADNTAGIGSLAVSYPPAADLGVDSLTLPETLAPGQAFSLQLQVTNSGGLAAPAEGLVEVGLVARGADLSSMISLGYYTLVAADPGTVLAPGGTLALEVPGVQLPADIPLEGDVQLVVILNPGNEVYEQPENRDNNTFVAEESRALPRTLGLSLSRTEVTEGSGVKVVYTITRSGDCSQALAVEVDCALAARLGLPSTLTIAAGQSNVRYQASPVDDETYQGNQTAEIRVSAAGYADAQATLEVLDDELPTLSLTLSAGQVVEGGSLTGTVSMDTVSTTDTVIKLGSTLSSQITMPATVTILAGQTSATFEIATVDDEVAEIDKTLRLTAAADGFNSGSADLVVVDDDLPQVELRLSKAMVSESDGYYALTATLVRTGGSTEAITVSLEDVDQIGLILPSNVKMAAGVGSVSFIVGVIDDSLANGERTGRIRGSITLDDCGCDASSSTNGGMVEASLTVQDNDTPALAVAFSKTVIREGGGEQVELTVSSNYASDQDLVITLGGGAGLSLPGTLVLEAGKTSVSCLVTAPADGESTGSRQTSVTASADGYATGAGYMQIADMDMPDLVVSSILVEGAALAGQEVVVRVTVSNQGYLETSSPCVVGLVLSDGTSLGTLVLDAPLSAGGSKELETRVKLPATSGTYTIMAEVDTQRAIAELDEKNNYGVSQPFAIGTGYTVQASVSQKTLYGAGSVVIEGCIQAEADGLPLQGQVVRLQICNGQGVLQYWDVVTGPDGHFSTEYTVPQGISGQLVVKGSLYADIGHELDSFAVAGLSVATRGSDLQWLITEGESKSGTITIRNQGGVDLSQVRLVVEGVPDNVTLTYDTTPVNLSAGESVQISYTIEGHGANVGSLYSALHFRVESAEQVSVDFKGYSYVLPPAGDLELDSNQLSVTLNQDSARYVELSLANMGGGDTGRITISLPEVDWMQVYSGSEIANLGSGEQATIVLKLDASASEVLLNAPYMGKIALSSENGGSEVVDFQIRFVATNKASLTVNVYDAFSLQMEDNRIIAGAKVTLYDAYTNEVVATALADDSGVAAFEELEAGYYNIGVDATDCAPYKVLIQLQPGEEATQPVYLTNETVSYTFVVTPTQVEDQYEIVQYVNFTTNVPAATLVFDTPVITIPELDYGESTLVSFTVTNYGLVAAQGYSLTLPSFEGLSMVVLNPVDTIAAQSSHTFMVEVTAKSLEESKSGSLGNMKRDWECLTGYAIQNWFDCTSNGNWRFNSIAVQTAGDCETKTLPVYDLGTYTPAPNHTSFESTRGSTPWYSKPSSGTSSYRIPQLVQELLACSPCKADAMNTVLKCKGWDKIEIKVEVSVCTKIWATALIPGFGELTLVLVTVCKMIEEVIEKLECIQYVAEHLEKCGGTIASELWNTLKNHVGGNKGATLAPDAWTSSAASKMSGLMDCMQVCLDLTASLTGPFDIRPLLLEGNVQFSSLQQWLTLLDQVTKGDSYEDKMISAEELGELRACALYAEADSAYLDSLCEKWNQTMAYNSQGIFSVQDVPSGGNTDFYSQEYLDEIGNQYQEAVRKMDSLGYSDGLAYFADTANDLYDYIMNDESEVCASVKLQFSQTATMSREAFEGELTLSNHSLGNMTDIYFTVFVKDMNGVDVSDHFHIDYYHVEGLGSISGGSLDTGSTGKVNIRFIPDKTIAAAGSEQYRFSGSLCYTDPNSGEKVDLALTPVTLQVNPSPDLVLHYFLSENSYSDDPYTEVVEAAQRAEIGLLVKNQGLGTAYNFTMSDFHPDFISNETGLALDVTMLGSSLNGGALQQSGTSLSFGDIQGMETSTAIWYFSTNLHGYFSNYTSTFRNLNGLGEEAFSLIDSTVTHMLTHSMDADGDGKMDFLVNDVEDALGLADGIYFGDGSYADVHAATGVLSTSGQLGNGSQTITLSMHAAEGWNYFRINDPGDGKYRIAGVSLNGQELDSSLFWQTDRVFAGDGSATYVNHLHVVCEAGQDGAVELVLHYTPTDVGAPEVLGMTGVGNQSTIRQASGEIRVQFSEEVNPDTFSLACVELYQNGQKVNVAGLAWEWENASTLHFLNLQDFTQQDAVYRLVVRNAGVEDVYGNAGDGVGRDLSWTLASQSLAVESVSGHDTRPLNTQVEQMYISFTVAVDTFSSSALSLYLTKEDGSKEKLALGGGISVSQVDTEGKLFAVSGLKGLQQKDGLYSLEMDGSMIVDSLGGACLETIPVAWELHATPPSLVESAFVEQEQLLQSIDTLVLHFSHAIASLDTAGIKVYRNGELYSCEGLQAVVNSNDATMVTLKGLSSAVPAIQDKGASATDGEWMVEVDLSAALDVYGNTGTGIYQTDWVADTTPPETVQSITINGEGRLACNSTSLVLGFALPEEGLVISVYEKQQGESGKGVLLWQGKPEGLSVEQGINLTNAGFRVLTIVLQDVSGNASTSEFGILVDVVALTVETDLAETYTEVPEKVRLTFNAAVDGLTMDAISLSVNGKSVSLEGATLVQINETEWELAGLHDRVAEAGSYTLSIDRSTLSKASSGLQGQGTYTHEFVFDSVTEVRVADCQVESTVGRVTGITLTFSTGINYTHLEAEGLLSQAIRLVNQADGSVTLLDANGFRYEGETLSWEGSLPLAAGDYTVVVDPLLVTAANGSPLVTNDAGSASGLAFTAVPTLLSVSGNSYSAPYAYDWDGDGFVDLLVGEKTGDGLGKVRFYRNDGNGGFDAFTYVQADGEELSVVASGCQGIVVAVQDLNGDGRADLVAGLSDGSVYAYTAQEDGSLGAAWLLTDATGQPLSTGSRAYPTFHDYTGDGVVDLILGTGDGRLLVAAGDLSEEGSLTFAAAQEIQGVTVSGRAAPQFVDVNGDGLSDLLIGDAEGNLTLFYNNGAGYVEVTRWSLEGVSWERARATVADLNGDGLADLVVGGSTGQVYVAYGSSAAGWGQDFSISAQPVLSDLSARAEGHGLALEWQAVGAEGYSVQLQISSSADFAGAAVYTGITGSAYTVSGLEDGMYYWRAQLVDAAGEPVGSWVEGKPVVVDMTPPEQPAGLVSVVEGNTASLSWGSLPDAAHYEVRYSQQEDFVGAASIRTEAASLSLPALEEGTWYWSVRAVDAAGNTGEWSESGTFGVEEAVQPGEDTVRHLAQGITTDAAGNITGGYYDANKVGNGDSNLCWAASSANMVAWWQQRYGEAMGLSGLPTAEDIYAAFVDNWQNVGGREEYGLSWWIAGGSDSEAYQDFYAANHREGAEGGAAFGAFYQPGTVSGLVSETRLGTGTATELAGAWEAVFSQGGILSLGVYKSITSTGTVGGHTLTLWGFTVQQSTGLLSSVTVSDSDDGFTGVCTLNLSYNVSEGRYQLNSPGSLNGYYLGDYTVLAAYADLVAPQVTLNEVIKTQSGEGKTRIILSWACSEEATFTLVVDGATYEVGAATSWELELEDGGHTYSVVATDAAGNTGRAEGQFTTDATAPEAVANLKAQVKDGAVAFSWSAAVDDSDVLYEVQYAFSPDFKKAQSVTGLTETQCEVAVETSTGLLYWRVKATDAVGNTSSWSAVMETPLDVVAPEMPASGLAVLAHGTTARLSWQPAQDPSGIAGYIIEVSTDASFGDIVRRSQTDGTFLQLEALEEGTSYYWRIAAQDKAGNIGEWAEYERPFQTGAAEARDDTPQEALEIVPGTTAQGWVGFDDPQDYYRFTAAELGSYAVSLVGETDALVYLRVGTLDASGVFQTEYQLVAGPGSASKALSGIVLEKGEERYIQVSAYDNGLGNCNGEYSLSIRGEVPEAGTQITANNSVDEASELSPSTEEEGSSAIQGWVGVGDATDYYQLELAEAGSLKLGLSGLETAAKVKVYTEDADGGIRQVYASSVKASSGLDRVLSLVSGTYFVQVSSYDNGAGRYNTGYALSLEHESQDGGKKTRYTLASIGR